MKNEKKKKRKLRTGRLIVLIAAAAAVISIAVYAVASVQKKTAQESPEPTAAETDQTEVTAEPTAVPTMTPTPTADVTDTSSLLICANKKHALPDGYEPSDLVAPNVTMNRSGWTLRQEAASALEQMFAAAQEDGITLVLGSAYRSYDYQKQLYDGYVASSGQEYADTISSRPGYSDHQTGLAVDISDASGANFLCTSFEDTEEGKWLAENAHKYGWIMRYPKGKQDITGYAYEPWHFRYVGVDYAKKIYETDPNETFEEYFNVEGGDYAS